MISWIKRKDWETIFHNLSELNWRVFLLPIVLTVNRMIFRGKKQDGFHILNDSESWDYLIILDACRYDRFEQINDIPGKLQKIQSKGCVTDIWLRENFNEDNYDDLVYISSTRRISSNNPTFNPVLNGPFDAARFHEVIEVFEEDEAPEKGDYVKAEEVTREAVKAKNKYPEKKLVIHYFQPHCPYKSITEFSGRSPQEYYNEGYSKDEISTAYNKNLKYVLEEVKNNLLPHLDGKIIISSDHGEQLGEKGLWGHYIRIPNEKVIKAPWLEVQKE